MRKWSIIWVPVLLVGAMTYWTLALGFGGLSLITLTSGLSDPDGMDRDSYQSIVVNLSEPTEGEAAEAVSHEVDFIEGPTEQVPIKVDLVSGGGPTAHGGAGQGSASGTTHSEPGQTAF
jgi:hypothetical protein